MSPYRLASAALLGLLVLILTACVAVGPAPSVLPTGTAGTLPTETVVATGSESTPAGSPLATPAAAESNGVPQPSVGKGTIAGRLIDVNASQPMTNQNLSLPAVVCPAGVAEDQKREQCVYVIDTAFDPSAITDGGGRFVFSDIAPGDYVMLVGNPTTKYTVLTNDSNQPLIWKAEADKVTELGDLAVVLP